MYRKVEALAERALHLNRFPYVVIAFLMLAFGSNTMFAQENAEPVQHVIHISVDGLRPDAVTKQAHRLPNFTRLRSEGAFTDNARTDFDFGNTLPNHMAQLTGRSVEGTAGHGWMSNKDPLPGETLHSRKGEYVPSVFDVVHDNGLRTAAYVSKSKFVLLDRSYDAVHGAPDETGSDDGRDKIDNFVYDSDTRDLVDRFVRDMQEDPYAYTFIHLRDPDIKGHRWGFRTWGWHPYMRAVRKVDGLLGEIFHVIENDPQLKDNTAVILTSDHGGSGHSHGASNKKHYTIPYYVWGPDVPAVDLYEFNADLVQEPGTARPDYDAPVQPIRNGSSANLAAAMLGLDPVPGSTINSASLLRVFPAKPAAAQESAGGSAVN